MVVVVVVVVVVVIFPIISMFKSSLQLSPSFCGGKGDKETSSGGAGGGFMFIPLDTPEQHRPSQPRPAAAAAAAAVPSYPSVAISLQELIAQGMHFPASHNLHFLRMMSQAVDG